MGKNRQLDKGNYLENAVEKIQKIIISKNPSLNVSDYIIVRKKRINSGGVHKEIDVYIKINPGNRMESIFIFECKNWEDPVNANEITIFSKKIEETGATKGFFVAKSFTKDALKEAEKDIRVVLLKAIDDFSDHMFPKSHAIYEDASKRIVEVVVCGRGMSDNNVEDSLLAVDSLIFNGKEETEKEFFSKLAQKTVNEKISHEATQFLDAGEYEYRHEKEFLFDHGSLIINGKDIEKIVVKVNFWEQVILPSDISKFYIEGMGMHVGKRFGLPKGGYISENLVITK